MRRLLSATLYLGFVTLVGLAQYEITEHAHQRWDCRWPGWQCAVHAELVTPWRPASGIPLLDHLVHEGIEAAVYYRGLLWGSPDGLQLSQNG